MYTRAEISLSLLLGLFVCLFSGPLQAQGPATRWYLGRSAGVSFAQNPPAPLLNASATFRPDEGGASIADANGQLLFYTDGTQVYNRLHQLMPGSTALGGHVSSSQSALIVRQPGSSRYYWVFTTDAIEMYPNAHRGLRYTVVDIQANAGLGGVDATRKSIALQSQTAEKLTACYAANGEDVWVLSHGFGNNTFYAWKLTATGLTTTPVTSNVGTAHGSMVGGNFNPGRGCMKVSPSGSFIATVILPPLGGRWVAELFRFNNMTGQVSLEADLSEASLDPNGYNYYGVEFSPSGSFLYISTRKGPYHLQQFDLCSASPASTRTIVGSSTNAFGTLQLGPDGRIYCAKNSDPWLGVITQPETAGTNCRYQDQGLNLTGRTSTFGLNNLNQSLFYRSRSDIQGTPACPGLASQVQARLLTCARVGGPSLQYSWNFGDPTSGAANTATGLNASHIYAQGGRYRVRLEGRWGESVDTSSFVLTVAPRPQARLVARDSNFCQGNRVFDFVTQPAGQSLGLWIAAGGISSSFRIEGTAVTAITTANGGAWIRYAPKDAAGCVGDTQRVAWTVNQQPAPAITGPETLCVGHAPQLYQAAAPGTYRWLIDRDTLVAAPGPSVLAAGPHSLRLLASTSRAGRVCYTDGPEHVVLVNEPLAVAPVVWDSAFCQETGMAAYALAPEATGSPSAQWTVEGGQIVGSATGASLAVEWDPQAALRYVSVEAATTPACPAQRFGGTVSQRCLEVINIVTANGDGANDYLHVANIEAYPNNEFRLYNRYGRLVLKTEGFRNEPVAEALLPGVYYYQLAYKAGGNDREKKGWIEILR